MPDVNIKFGAETKKALSDMKAVDAMFERVQKRVDAASKGIIGFAAKTEAASGKAVAALQKWDAAARRAAESSSKTGSGLSLTNRGGSGGRFSDVLGGGGGKGGGLGAIGGLATKLGTPFGLATAGAFAAGGAFGVLEGAGRIIENYNQQEEAAKLLKGAVTDLGGSYSQTAKDVEVLGSTLALGTAESYKAETAALSLAAALGKTAETAKASAIDAAHALAGMGKDAKEIPGLLGKIESGGDIFGDIGRTNIGGTDVRSNDALYKAYAENILNVRRELTELEKVEARRFALTAAASESSGQYEKSLKTVSKQADLLGQKMEDMFAGFVEGFDKSTMLTGALEGLNDALGLLGKEGFVALGGGIANAIVMATPLLTVLKSIRDLSDEFAGVTPADRAAQDEAKKQNEIDRARYLEKQRHQQALDLKNRLNGLVTSDLAYGVNIGDRQGKYDKRDPFLSARPSRLIGGANQSREGMLELLADDPSVDPQIRAAAAARKSKLDAAKYGLASSVRSNISGAQGIYGNILSTRLEMERLKLAPAVEGQVGRYGAQDITDERGLTTRFARGRYGQRTDQILHQGAAAETLTADKQFDEVMKADAELRAHLDKLVAGAPSDLTGQLSSEANLARLAGLKGQLGGLDASKLDAGRLEQLKGVLEEYQKTQAEQLVKQLELQIQMAKDLERLRIKLVNEDPELAPITRLIIEDKTAAAVKVVQPVIRETADGYGLTSY